MKIVIISDNHGRIEPIQNILYQHQDADAFIHCGDSELPVNYLAGYVAVRGNNDFYAELPDYRVLEIGNHRILIAHGHRLMFLDNRELLVNKAKSLDCDVICFGHSHIFESRVIDDITLINPGSISKNRDGSAPSYAILTINNNQLSVERKEYK